MLNLQPRLQLWQRAAALAAAALLGALFLLLGWRGVAAQSPAAGAIWFVNNTPGEGLVGYWQFDQIFSSTLPNAALLNNRASFSNGANLNFSNLPPLAFSNLGKLALDGVNDFMLVPDAAQLDVAPDHFSVAAWVRRTTSNTSDLIYDSGTGPGHWYFGFLGGLNDLVFTLNGVTDIHSTHVVTDSNWHHVAAVKNGSGPGNLLLYLDGVAAPALTVTVTVAPTGTKTIGIKNGAFNTPFAGDIDELRLYNRALSATEVQRLAHGRGCVSDGLTWATAFANLQCALRAAHSGDEIWVARSLQRYRPGTSINISFDLPSGVGLFGGFQGSELNRSQRPPVDFEQNEVTTLSGDLLGDDLQFGGGKIDNGHHVVRSVSPAAGTLFDGLRVEGGSDTLNGAEGGGLEQTGPGQLQLANDMFDRNQVHDSGGGLYAEAVVTLTNVLFQYNSADAGGGAALLGPAVISGGVFLGNNASNCGGLGTEAVLTVTGVTFALNQAINSGGGACADGPAAISLSTFLLNQASQGGGLEARDSLILTDTQFLTNTAAATGGAVDSQVNQPIRIHGGLFASNTVTGAVSLGGAIAERGRLNVDGASFVGNSAATGGAVAALFFTARFTNTVFLGNRAVFSDGGALWLRASPAGLTNVLLVGNQAASRGGGLYLETSPVSLTQVTAVSNTAAISGSLVFANASATQVFNSVVWRNGPGLFGLLGSSLDYRFNLGDAGLVDTGNLAGAPIFLRNPDPGDGDWATLADNDYGDLRLAGDSPGIDAGNNTLAPAGLALDLAGQPRFLDVASVPDTGVGPAPIVDMGAFEYQLQQLFLPLLTR